MCARYPSGSQSLPMTKPFAGQYAKTTAHSKARYKEPKPRFVDRRFRGKSNDFRLILAGNLAAELSNQYSKMALMQVLVGQLDSCHTGKTGHLAKTAPKVGATQICAFHLRLPTSSQATKSQSAEKTRAATPSRTSTEKTETSLWRCR